ncbi:MAG: signal peptidase I [Candidatus Saccharibacteria bacterium]|nr:signal peptidase I [Candidatus Saccharibacteria bacterium]
MMESGFFDRHPKLRDSFGLVVFVIGVIIGTIFINSFIFRNFTVQGASMEPTMHTGDRLIVNRIPVTISQLQNKPYTPERGQTIVFKNPNFNAGTNRDEYIVKRVIAFAGERVTVKDGVVTVYTADKPEGFNPDPTINKDEPGQPTSGDVDTVVSEGTIFVMGDHRQGNHSCDSRSCMGNIPLFDVIGPVSVRIWPLTKIRTF